MSPTEKIHAKIVRIGFSPDHLLEDVINQLADGGDMNIFATHQSVVDVDRASSYENDIAEGRTALKNLGKCATRLYLDSELRIGDDPSSRSLRLFFRPQDDTAYRRIVSRLRLKDKISIDQHEDPGLYVDIPREGLPDDQSELSRRLWELRDALESSNESPGLSVIKPAIFASNRHGLRIPRRTEAAYDDVE